MIRLWLFAFVTITILSVTGFAVAPEVKLYPVDEASQDPSFKLFRDELTAALKRRDRKFLLSILDKQIQNSFGGDGGVKEFVSMWHLDAGNSPVWTELLTIISMGGSFIEENGQRVFYAPYVSSRWDAIQDKLPQDAEDTPYAAALRKEVRIYRRPTLRAAVVGVLSYHVVEIDYEGGSRGEEYPWIKIKNFKGHDGYVLKNQIRSPTDYRAMFKKVGGKWVMHVLVAGD